ncbi:hypothetical protein DIC66_14065 [Rhodoferax lacus]|uniref:DUF4148 domain-containing protein n=1 Tax=Rhodoferax lacus TaxID=2184758 RepID=A0A3E1RAP9_9BURK|nr:hypothetical protein DIC66_14065 [Rhodoferax lacus]
MSHFTCGATAAVALAIAGNSAIAQDRVQSKTQDQARDQDRLQAPIFGSQLMTDAERNEFRTHMRSLKTVQEREVYRMEHHKRMQERAQAQGIALPASPPAMPQRSGAGAALNGMGGGSGAGAGGGGMGAGPRGTK